MTERGAVRLLALGNELLADDAFGFLVAGRAAQLFPHLEVTCSSQAGLALLDHLTGVSRLILVDTVQTGRAAPGTIYVLEEADLRTGPAVAPHGASLRDALELARQLDLGAPEQVLILAVEAADCTTIGGAMHPAVEAAAAQVLELIGQAVAGRPLKHPGCEPPERSPQ